MKRFILVILLYVVLNVYIGLHGSYLLSLYSMNDLSFTIVYWVLFWIVAFSYLLARIRLLPLLIKRLLKVIGSYYFGILSFAIIVLPIVDIVGWFLRMSDYDAINYVPIMSTVVLILLIILLLRGSWNAWNPIVRTYEISVDKQAGDMKEIKIAVASDLHLGNIVGNRHLGRLVEYMNAIKPDLILLPGDVLDDDIEPFIRNRMSDTLKQLKAQFGIYAVLGNHEYYGGQIEEYVQRMSAIGIRVLRDEYVFVNDAIHIVGRKDKTAESFEPTGRISIPELLSGLDVTRPVILMDHQPHHLSKAAEAGVDLMLSGHTHKGQFAPNHFITRRIFELDWGYLLKDKMHVVVSSGFGTWGPPIRLGSRSEIVEIVVRFQS